MLSVTTVMSAELVGIHSRLLRIQVSTPENGPAFQVVGLSENAERELRIRVRSSFDACGLALPERVHVSVPKLLTEGVDGLDLAVAVGVWAHSNGIAQDKLASIAFFGNLRLTGHVQACRGIACHMRGAADGSSTGWALEPFWTLDGKAMRPLPLVLVIPNSNASEAWSPSPLPHRGGTHLRWEGIESLSEAIAIVQSPVAQGLMMPGPPAVDASNDASEAIPLRVIERFEAAAASGLGVLIIDSTTVGFVGARRFHRLMPPLSPREMRDVAMMTSASGIYAVERPFRAPHHTVSDVGLLGQVHRRPRPGEVSLAHHGVLYLDAVHEYHRSHLERLEQALTDGVVWGTQEHLEHFRFPARPALVVGGSCIPTVGGPITPTDHGRARIKRLAMYRRLFPLVLDMRGDTSPADRTASADVASRLRRAWDAGMNPARASGPRASTHVRLSRALADLDGSIDVSPVHIERAQTMLVEGERFYAEGD